MKIVQVTYTAKAEFVEQNQRNIQAVIADLQELHRPGIRYTVCLSDDGATFIHRAFFTSDEDEKVLTELPSFTQFQEQLRSGGLAIPPKQELLQLVGSSSTIVQ